MVEPEPKLTMINNADTILFFFISFKYNEMAFTYHY